MDGAFPSAIGDMGSDGDSRRRGFRGTQENAKTKLCQRWKQGHCRFGDSCNFAHGEEELRQLPAKQAGGRGQNLGPSTPVQYSRTPQDGAFHQSGVGQAYGGGYNTYSTAAAAHAGIDQSYYAQQGQPVPGPDGWTQYTTLDTKEKYYHNARTGATVWDKPKEWTR